MQCPACGQHMQPVMRYLDKKLRWYQFGRAGSFCPKCDRQLVPLWTRPSRILYQISAACLFSGVVVLIVDILVAATPALYMRLGEALIGVGTLAFLAYGVTRRMTVAPTDAT